MTPAVAEVQLPLRHFLLPVAEVRLLLGFFCYRNWVEKAPCAPSNGQENANLKAEKAKKDFEPSTVAEVADFLLNVELAHGLASTKAFTHASYVKISKVLSTLESLLLLLPVQVGSQNTGRIP